MSGEYTTITVPDGAFKAYVTRPAGDGPAPAVVVLQEIFGVNAVMRGMTDDLAARGFLAICPDLFWRLQPGVDITDQTPEEWKIALDLMNRFDADEGVKDIQATIDAIRIVTHRATRWNSSAGDKARENAQRQQQRAQAR